MKSRGHFYLHSLRVRPLPSVLDELLLASVLLLVEEDLLLPAGGTVRTLDLKLVHDTLVGGPGVLVEEEAVLRVEQRRKGQKKEKRRKKKRKTHHLFEGNVSRLGEEEDEEGNRRDGEGGEEDVNSVTSSSHRGEHGRSRAGDDEVPCDDEDVSIVDDRGEEGKNVQSQLLVAARHWETCRTAPGKTSAFTTHGVPFQVTA